MISESEIDGEHEKKDKNKRYAFFSNEFLRDQKKNYRFSFFKFFCLN